MAQAETSPPPRRIADRYTLRGELGAGGMGVVYEAFDERLSRPVALKLIHPHRDAASNAIERLEREALSAARLGHPNIVRVLDFGRAEDGAFLVMEQLTGETLEARVVDRGRLDPARAVKIHLQLLDALDAAHAEGVVHRDVKPSNVYLTRLADGSELVKLLDFGLAYLLEEAAAKKLTATGIAIGTPAYMSPERVRGAPVDARSDLYAVGVSLYECLTGELPFAAATPVALRGQILLEQAPSIRDKRPEIAAALVGVVERAMAKEPDARFATARAMSEALRAAADGLTEHGDAGTEAPADRAPAASTQSGFAEERAKIESSETMPAIPAKKLELGTQETLAAIPAGTQRGLGRLGDAPEPAAAPALPATRAPGELAAPPGKERDRDPHATLPRGGITRPHARAREPVSPPTAARKRPARAGWMVGLAVGMGGGLLVLAALWIWHVSGAPEPTAPPAAAPVTAEEVTPEEVTPEDSTPEVAAPAPAPEPTAPVEVVGVDPPEPEVAAEVEAPPRRPRPRPRPRPTTTTAPPPAPTPPPPRRLPASSIDGPLEPDWGSPPPR